MIDGLMPMMAMRNGARNIFEILAPYGANAHLYIPNQQNFTDTAGTIPATDNSNVLRINDLTGGLHLAQPNSSLAMTLLNNGGVYSWDHQDPDFLESYSAAFNLEDEYTVIVGFICTNVTQSIEKGIFCAAHSTTFSWRRAASIWIQSDGKIAANWYNGADNQSIVGSTLNSNVPYICSVRKVGSVASMRLNGSSVGSSITVLGSSTLNNTAFCIAYRNIGVLYGRGFAGKIYPAIAIKGAVSLDDLAALESEVARLSGFSI